MIFKKITEFVFSEQGLLVFQIFGCFIVCCIIIIIGRSENGGA